MNKGKYLFALMATVTILAIIAPTLTYAQAEPSPTVNIYAWTDKTSYDPGEKGTLKIVVRNDKTDEDLILYNITIEYPWFSFTGDKWEGNDTIVINEAISKNGGSKMCTRDFTVPSDGRALMSVYGSTISIRINVDKAPYHYDEHPSIYVKSTPLFISLEDGDKAIMLFTILVVLVIICTIILAATIFLSSRKPQIPSRLES
jgi:hypothetical protein